MTAVKPRVLYVDDDAGLLHLVARHLKREGFDVETANDGDTGLALLGARTFDVIALDQFMPGRDGLDVLSVIRAMSDPPPVVFVTGADESRVAVSALKAGAADYVIKDVDGTFFTRLVTSIRQALHTQDLLRQRQAADHEMRLAREKAEVLLREVNHRVANSLSLVASFVSLQASHIGDEAARSALRETQSRIMAIAHVHRSLYTSDDVRSIAMPAYLTSLLDDLQGSISGTGQRHEIRTQLEEIELPPDKAVSVGVIVAELVTNALKYAYPHEARGTIRVSLRHTPKGIDLRVEDDGVGWEGNGSPRGTGLGMKIVTAMAKTLQTEVVIARTYPGTRIALDFVDPSKSPNDACR